MGHDPQNVIRSMIVGAALAQLDRLDDATEPSFDEPLADVPSVLAWNE